MEKQKVYDCIVIGASPGGLQAAIYLGRYNRDVLIIDRGGGRTSHARDIENFLSHRHISGREILEIGLEQARSFHAQFMRGRVMKILKPDCFEVYTDDQKFLSKFVIVSSGGYDNLPPVDNVHKFLGKSLFTCLDCDGYKTTGKKLVIIGNSIHSVRLSLAMNEMYTKDITLLLIFYDPPQDYKEEMERQGIKFTKGRPGKIIGDERMEALELQDGRMLACEVIMSDFGFKLNDDFLSEMHLKKDRADFKYVTDRYFESSVYGLYIVGPLNTGHDQAIIAAGEGAVAAIEINKKLLVI
ncbi:MAG: NAD(P)/FAD-dependent oxidoreductase [Nitrospirota bacterium]